MNVNILIKDIEVLLEKYKEFILSISPQTSPSNLARYMLYSKAFNSFSSSLILTQKGFYVESYNSIRFGLESGWLAILFEKRPELALQWLLLIPITEGNMEKAARNYRHDLGSPVWVRKQISKGKSDKEQKGNVYSALSTKSHANVSSTFYLTTDGEVNLYGPGAFESVEHMKKSLKAIKFCLGFLWYIHYKKPCPRGISYYHYPLIDITDAPRHLHTRNLPLPRSPL